MHIDAQELVLAFLNLFLAVMTAIMARTAARRGKLGPPILPWVSVSWFMLSLLRFGMGLGFWSRGHTPAWVVLVVVSFAVVVIVGCRRAVNEYRQHQALERIERNLKEFAEE